MNKFNILGSVNPPMNNSPLTLDINIIDCDSNNFFADNEAVETKRIEQKKSKKRDFVRSSKLGK